MSFPLPSRNPTKAINARASSAARTIGLRLLVCGLSLSGTLVCRAQTHSDVIVYGSTPGGYCAAIGAAREGASVILLEPTTHVGGMNTGGLSFSDSDQMYREQLMGLFHEWHLRIQKDYEKRGITLPYDVNVKNQAVWSYEALVAQRVTDAMLAEAGVKVLTERYLQSVTRNGPRITGIVTSKGTFTGRVFIDGSYEGDLMAAAGVSWRIDREGRAEYGESHAGRQYPKSLMNINGFDDEGKPLPLITAVGKGPDEIGDDELMVYSFRIPMTKNAANKVAMPAPENYDPARFELIRRFVKRHGEAKVNFSTLPVPNQKIDANNAIDSQFSIGLVGGAKEWAEADQAGRSAILEAHKQYTLEFIHFMKTDPVFSQKRRDDIAGWGLCADEFAAYGHFPPQLYVRASRRMKGMHVMTEADILDDPVKSDPIMVASFPIDSHDCRRVAIKDGGVINEGTIFPVRQMPQRIGYPHHVPYRAILPQATECDNLLVPVALSCTHAAMSSLRIEATWMLIGQSAGIAAALVADKDVAVQDLPYATLKPRLEAQGQVLTLPKGFQPAEKPVSGETSQSLDGVWRFTTDASNPPESWVDMNVPGNWDSTPGFSKYVGVGWYRRTFTPDPSLKGKSVRLHFGAVYHEAEVFLNGKSIGTHVGGYTPFEFDVSDKLVFGQPNEIIVSADNTYKRGAWWPWGGISRSVTLIGNNPVRLVLQHIHGDPDLKAGTASVSVKYRLRNTGTTPADVNITSCLASWDKELVNATHTVNAGETKDFTARFDLPKEQVRLWHFDHPEFYHIETTLTVSGEVQHAVSDRFGIRKIEVTATEFRLNGEPVRLVGFNRVADDAGKYGNTEPDVLVNTDVDLMKRAGANMQRINCVPQATTLLNRMDEKGMMIVVGIPVWGDDPQTTVVDNPLTKQWLREMIERDHNHPCIIGWEVANESYQYLGYHENMIDYVRKELDPHRLVTFASWNSYRTDVAGTENHPVEKADLPMINMYRTFTEKLATQTARWPDKPFFLSECGMYQLKGGIDADFDPGWIPGWESFARGQFPNLIGAGLWCFNDYRSNFRNTPPTGFRSWGVVDQHRKIKPAYYTIRKLHSPVEILQVDGTTATVKTRPPGHLPSYTLKGYKLVWEKGERKGEIPLPTLKPGDPAWTVDLPVPGATLKLVTPLGYDIDDTMFDAIRFVPVSKPQVRISGVYPHLAVTSEHPEVGIGAVAPWSDRLWAVTYGPHISNGDSSNKLYEIDDKLNRVVRPESLGGTPANRFIHEPSKQLIIGPHFIDASRKVRNLPYTAAPGRYTATAAHLTDPDRIYMFTMEDGLYDVNVKDLSFITRYPDVQPRGDKFLFGYHGKGAFTGQGYLIAANNGRPLNQDTPLEPSGTLARWDGTTYAKNGNSYLPLPAINSNTRYEYNDGPVSGQPEFMAGWTHDFTVQHCEVTGPGGIRGNPDPATDPVWATGFDAKSVLVRVLESGTWNTWRLPKASFTHDGSHGWHTEWPRIRQLDPGNPGSPYLMHMHGLFYNFPASFSSADFSGITPLCSYYKMPVDYCMFNGELVIAKNDLSKFGNRLAPRAQSNFWFGQLEDLADWGAPQGHGGVWMNDRLAAGERSDPFLVNGFTRITLHLRNHGDAEVPVRVESSKGSKTWTPVTTIKVPAAGYVYEILNNLPAEWLRLTADAAAGDLTAYFTLSNPYPHQADAVIDTDHFAALTDIHETTGLSDGMIRPMSGPDLQLEFASDNGYHQIGEALALQDIDNANAESALRSQGALKKDFGGDAASVWITEGSQRLRLPRLDPLYDAPFPSGWARGFREVVTERELLNCHGTFYEVPRENSGGRYRIQPLATHGKGITDFASWRGLLVLTGVRDDAPASDSLVRSPSGAALWLGEVDDIWQMGEPRGTGGPWKNTAVTAGSPSDPYLMVGYDHKELTLTTSAAAAITVEVDFLADNTWSTYQTFPLAAGETLNHVFPEGFSAHWVRVKSDTRTTATARFDYGPADQ